MAFGLRKDSVNRRGFEKIRGYKRGTSHADRSYYGISCRFLYPELFVVQAEIAVHGNIIIPGFVLSVLQHFIL